MLKVFVPLMALVLVSCNQQPPPAATKTTEDTTDVVQPTATETEQPSSMATVDAFTAQPAEVQARYVYRHPKETLDFFGIKPGMTVAEALPGGGWYSKILLSYLGKDGKLIGVDYPLDLFSKFGFFSTERLEAKKTWTTTWTEEANSWRTDDSALVTASVFGSMPESTKGTADAFLLIRAVHNLNRFENDGGFLTSALKDVYQTLKPGGIVGVVQHQAAEDKPDEWADGSKGYLKKSHIIKQFENAGFKYVDSSDINANPKDQPGESDIVWRLPPNFATSKDNPELKAQMQAIGESNRMTLKFIKP